MDKPIPMDECVRGRVYALHCRNLLLGVYAGNHWFIGVRQKFGDRFLDVEVHRDAGGTVTPYLDLGLCPVTDLRETVGTRCNEHGREAYYIRHEDQTVRVGSWYHSDDGSELGDNDWPVAVQNRALFEWLEAQPRPRDPQWFDG